jgi:hypothetical protein
MVQLAVLAVLMGASATAAAKLQWANDPTGTNTRVDQYRGAGPNTNLPDSSGIGDASGGSSYEIKSMSSTLSADGKMSIEVNTNFDQNSSPYFYGDLFFDTQWILKNNHSYDHRRWDDYTTGNDWKYVVHIDDVDVQGQDQATVYRISYDQPDPSVLPSREIPPDGEVTKEDILFLGSDFDEQEISVGQRAGYNSGQGEHWLDTVDDLESWGVLTEIGRADWSADSDSVNFDFDLFNLFQDDLTELGINTPVGQQSQSFDLAYRWSMSCGNDVIETIFNYTVRDDGSTQGVPEPGTLALFGLGALGLVGRRRLLKGRAA